MINLGIQAELLKLRRAPIWIAFIGVPVVATLFGCLNYANNREILTQEWVSLWTQVSLFMAYFFFPVLIAAGAAYLWRIEYHEYNLYDLMLQPRSQLSIFLSKVVVGSIFSAISLVTLLISYTVAGLFFHFSSPVPISLLFTYMCLGFICSLPILALQLLLSYLIKNFAIPIALSFAGAVLGLGASAQGVGHLFIYSLMQTGLQSNALVNLTPALIGKLCITAALYLVVCTIVATRVLKRKEVVPVAK